MKPSRRTAARVLLLALPVVTMLAAQHTAAAIFSATLPASRSVQTTQPATFFATMITTSPVSVTGCAVTLASAINATLTYQATNSATNQPIGAPNAPATIAAGGSQSFVLSLTANADVLPTDVEFGFGCNNDGPADVFPGLNTLLFSASSTPVPDIIALAATVGSTGIVEVPKDNGFGFFTVATINIGAGANIDVTAATGNTSAPATQILLCETNPQGACLSPATGPTVTTTIAANTTPTFAIFVRSTPTVAFDPANNRVFVTFRQNGVTRGSTSVAFRGGGLTSAKDVFSTLVSPNTVQTKCIACHFTGGAATLTRLILKPGNDAATVDNNFNVFKNFVATVPGAGDLIRNKVQGALAHGGGVQINAGTQEFTNLSRFLDLLGAEASSTPSAASLFDTVGMLSRQRTLRDAAMLFAGRLPTASETAAVDSGDDSVLRTTIRGVMQGEAFHDFLIEGANDRLLTDRELRRPVIDANRAFFVNHTQHDHDLLLEARITGKYQPYSRWRDRTNYGFARAPLELIAHVVMNDAPYSEVLTANYVMANPYSAEAYGGPPAFDDPDDAFEFKPTHIVDYYRTDGSKVTEFEPGTNTRIVNPGNLKTYNYPHTGILATNAFLNRYPSTSTNRNRARSRWTYYHFLGVNIEKSAPRTTDPVALADTNNPTMNNPACTVCHQVLDPAAGAFQDFGDDGYFRDQFGGLDSLDRFYKYPEAGGRSPYVRGDTWYRDMRTPAFGGAAAPSDGSSLPWLAGHIVADPRFATATVRFWWPAVMGAPALEPPEDQDDPNFSAALLGFSAQNTEIGRLAAGFRGTDDLKGLLVELIMSAWFRAATETSGDPTRQKALALAGTERLLTPEQLERKTRAVTGLSWGGWLGRSPTQTGARRSSGLTDQYRQFYGGIDSDGVTKRATELNAIMASVAQTHAAEMSCPIVMRELVMVPPNQRVLFGAIDRNVTPFSDFSEQYTVNGASFAQRATYSQTGNLSGSVRIRAFFVNDFYDAATKADRNLMLDRLVVRAANGAVVYSLEYQNITSVPGYITGCGGAQGGQFILWSSCEASVPWTAPTPGAYTIEVSAWGQQAGPEAPRLSVSIDGTGTQVKNQLVTLSRAFYNTDPTLTSPEIERLHQLLVAVWQRKSAADTGRWLPGKDLHCPWWIERDFFEGVLDDALIPGDYGEQWDQTVTEPYVNGLDMTDPQYMLQTWVVVLTAMLNDYRYLYL